MGSNATTLVVCSCASSQSLAKIMYGANWQEVGAATTTKVSTKGEVAPSDKGPKTILTLYAFSASSAFYFALPELERMSGDAVNPVVGQLFG